MARPLSATGHGRFCPEYKEQPLEGLKQQGVVLSLTVYRDARGGRRGVGRAGEGEERVAGVLYLPSTFLVSLSRKASPDSGKVG